MYGLIQHRHAHTHVAKSLLIIIVQLIQSPHARDKTKLIKYATHFRDGHAPTPNYTNHHSTVVPAPIARPAHDDYGGSAVGGRVVCGRAGRWMGGWASGRWLEHMPSHRVVGLGCGVGGFEPRALYGSHSLL